VDLQRLTDMKSVEGPSLGIRATSGAFWIALEMVAVQCLSLIVFSVLAHLLSPHDFGVMAITFTFVYSLKFLAIDQIAVPIIRKLNPTPLDWTTAFWLSIAFGLSATLLLCAFSFAVDPLLHTQGVGAVMRPMSLMLISFCLSRTQEAWLTRHFQQRVLAIRSIAGFVLGAAAGIAAALMGFGVWSLIIQQTVASFTSLGLLWSTTPWRPGFQFCRESSSYILSYVTRISGNTLLNVLSQNMDATLIALFFGTPSVGIYSIGKRLTLALQVIAANPINGVALPALAETQADPLRERRVFLVATQMVFACCAPVFFGAAVVAPPTIVLLFGAKWIGAANIVAWLSVSSLCMIAFGYFGNVLMLRNHPAWLTALTATQTVLSIGLFLLLHAIGWHMIAAPFVLPYIVTVPLCGGLALELLGIHWSQWVKAVGPPIISAVIMAIGVHLLSSTLMTMPALKKVAVLGMAGAVMYGICMLILARETLTTGLRLARRLLTR
jgi:O-antigen/teichoic acid export membrane protein